MRVRPSCRLSRSGKAESHPLCACFTSCARGKSSISSSGRLKQVPDVHPRISALSCCPSSLPINICISPQLRSPPSSSARSAASYPAAASSYASFLQSTSPSTTPTPSTTPSPSPSPFMLTLRRMAWRTTQGDSTGRWRGFGSRCRGRTTPATRTKNAFCRTHSYMLARKRWGGYSSTRQ